MIDDKKIEEAARRYSEVTDCTKEEALLIEEGFKEGANWAINEFLKDLWHDKHSDVYDWNALVYNFDITKWLYIEDLLAKEGDNQ